MLAHRRPIPQRAAHVRVCFRCGIEWPDYHGRWIAGAPCRDCRPMLFRDGISIADYRSEKAA